MGVLLLLGVLGTAAVHADNLPGWIEAVEHDRVQHIALLLPRAENVDLQTRTGKTALMAAARRGDHELVHRLIAAGADVEATNKGGGTPLHYAAWFGSSRTIELLVSRGAQVNHQSRNGWTALMMTAAKNHAAAATLLLESGAAPNLADIYRWTPLMRAAYAGHLEIVEILLGRRSTDVSVLNDQGQSALHLAVISGDERAVQLLLKARAPMDLIDAGGRTPKAIAQAMERSDLVELLERP